MAGRAGIVGLGTLASRFLGLARDMAMAAVFPIAATDAFWVAFTIPNALRQLLAEGAVTSAVVPVLAEARAAGGDEAARHFYARMRGLSLLVLVLVSIAGVFAAPWLVDLYAHGFGQRVGQLERTITLARWVFPYIFFMGTAALGMAALNTYGRFAVAAFAPALLNVAFLAASFGLPAWLVANGHDPALALAFAALVGGALQVAAQLPALRALGFLGMPSFDFRDERVRTVLRRIGPMTLGLGIYTVDLVVCRRFLAELGDGPQSYFSWAQRLCDFPQGIFVMALQTAAMPRLAALVAEGNQREVAATFAFSMRLSLFVGVAVSALFAGLAEPIVVALFQRGQFDATSAHETARALAAQGLGIAPVAAVRALVPVFFAMGDTRTPVIVSALDLLALIALSIVLAGPFGHVGISFAVAGSSLVQMLLLWVFLAKKLPDMRTGEIAKSALRTVAASVAGGGMAWWSARQVTGVLGDGSLARLFPAIVGGVVFGCVFVFFAALFRSEELDVLSAGLARKLGRRRG